VWELIEVCRGCRSNKLEVVLELKSMPLGIRFSIKPNDEPLYPLALSLCEDCGLVQLSHQVISGSIFSEPLVRSDIPDPIQADSSLQSRAASAPRKCLFIGGSLDTGNRGDGRDLSDLVFLEDFIYRQVEIGLLNSLPWEEMINDELIGALWDEYGEFDEINFDNSSKSAHPLHFSNVADPRGHVGLLSSVLSRDGVVSIRAPDFTSIMTHGHFGYIYHEHQSYFSTSTMQGFFKSLGFETQQIFSTDDGLNTRYQFVRNKKTRSKTDLYDVEQADASAIRNTRDRDLLLEFQSRLQTTSQRVQRELNNVAQVKKAGFGASVATVATMYQLGINEKLDFLVDDSVKFYDYYSPRDNLIVKDARTSCIADRSTVFVVLAARYEDQILKRHPELAGRAITTKMDH